MRIDTATLARDYEHIYSRDPALDMDSEENRERYRRALETSNGDELPLRPGQKPARWTLTHLRGKPRRVMQSFLQRTTSGKGISMEALYVACQLGLTGVSGLVDESGKSIPVHLVDDPETGVRVVAEASMQILDAIDDGALVNELGLRVITRLFPDPKS